MNTRQLAKTDLNLLKALQVLLEEKNVTRAAERLFITQPAMSKTLSRLRTLFDDPLFTRGHKSLIPTPKAEKIALKLPIILSSVEELIEEEVFDPRSFEGEIKIIVAAFFAYQLVPQLIEILSTHAPNMTVSVISQPTQSVFKDLGNGEVDFAIVFDTPSPAEIQTTSLGSIEPSIWMRKSHPLAEQAKPTLKEILVYPFVQYHIVQTGPVSKVVETRFDREIAKKGLRRNRLMITNQFITAIETLERTDCLMLAAINEQIGHSTYNIELVDKPYPEELHFDSSIPIVMMQHLRTLKSPAHQWLKQELLTIINASQQAYTQSR